MEFFIKHEIMKILSANIKKEIFVSIYFQINCFQITYLQCWIQFYGRQDIVTLSYKRVFVFISLFSLLLLLILFPSFSLSFPFSPINSLSLNEFSVMWMDRSDNKSRVKSDGR